MPTTIFDWMVRTAMLAMAGLVTLSILGAIATMANDPGTRFAGGDRPLIEAEPAQEREAPPQAPPPPADGNSAAAAASAEGQRASGGAGQGAGQGATAAAVPVPPPGEDKEARWLEAIAYALLALAGVGALGVLMLWRAVRELRRIADRQEVSR